MSRIEAELRTLMDALSDKAESVGLHLGYTWTPSNLRLEAGPFTCEGPATRDTCRDMSQYLGGYKMGLSVPNSKPVMAKEYLKTLEPGAVLMDHESGQRFYKAIEPEMFFNAKLGCMASIHEMVDLDMTKKELLRDYEVFV